MLYYTEPSGPSSNDAIVATFFLSKPTCTSDSAYIHRKNRPIFDTAICPFCSVGETCVEIHQDSMLEQRYKVQGARCKVQGARCKVQGARCKVQGARCKVQGATCNVQRATCKVQAYGFRAKQYYNADLPDIRRA
jgi:hypothetical protein